MFLYDSYMEKRNPIKRAKVGFVVSILLIAFQLSTIFKLVKKKRFQLSFSY